MVYMQSRSCPSLYFHIPFCKSKCRYCGFYSQTPSNILQVDQLLNAELKELELALCNHYAGDVPSIYLGGGTPSSIAEDMPDFIRNILNTCRANDLSTANTEFSVEVNPGDVNPDFFRSLQQLGVNRVSIGSQSFNDKELILMGRRHSSQEIYLTVKTCRELGLDNISLDLISSLPGQTLGQWRENLNKAIDLNPSHISVYSLSWEPDTEFDRLRLSGQLKAVDDELDREMYYLAVDMLAQAGICQYEISNFARPGMESRHNLRYWDDLDYLGIGPSAGSRRAGERWNNIADINEYILRMKDDKPGYDELLVSDKDDSIRQAAILSLRKCRGIDMTAFQQRFAVSPLAFFSDAIDRNIRQGYLELADNCIRLTRNGLSYADQVARDII